MFRRKTPNYTFGQYIFNNSIAGVEKSGYAYDHSQNKSQIIVNMAIGKVKAERSRQKVS